MDGFLKFFQELLTFDAYWKAVGLIVIFGTVCAYVFTNSLKDATTKYYASQKKPVPPWRGFMLTCFSSFVGAMVGLTLDMSILPIFETLPSDAPPDATPRMIADHYYLLSAQWGIGAGVLSSATVPLVRSIVRKRWLKKDGDSPDDLKAPDLGSWTMPLDQNELLQGLPESERAEAAKIFEAAEEVHKDEKGKTVRGEAEKADSPEPDSLDEELEIEDESTLNISLRQARLEAELAELEKVKLEREVQKKAEADEKAKERAERKAQLEKELAALKAEEAG